MSRVRRSAVRIVPILSTALLFASGLAGARIARAAGDVGSINFTLGYKRLSADWELGTPEITGTDTLDRKPASQPGLGIEATWGRSGWPVLVAFDVQHSYDDGVQRFPTVDLGADVNNVEHFLYATDVRSRASTLELALGLRRAFKVAVWEPFVGAGGCWVHANVVHETSDPTQGAFGTPLSSEIVHDSAFGYWAEAGLLKRFGTRFHIGVRARFSKAQLELPTHDVVGEEPYYHLTGVKSKVEAGGRNVGFVVGWNLPSP